jgi:hypothetical protein
MMRECRILFFLSNNDFDHFCACVGTSFSLITNENILAIPSTTKIETYEYLSKNITIVISLDMIESVSYILDNLDISTITMGYIELGATPNAVNITNSHDFLDFSNISLISFHEREKLDRFFSQQRPNTIIQFVTALGDLNDYGDVAPSEPKKLKLSKNWTKKLEDIKDETTTETNVQCIFCCENKIKVCIVPCGHFHFCVECFKKHLSEPKIKKTCPTCQGKIENIIKPLF